MSTLKYLCILLILFIISEATLVVYKPTNVASNNKQNFTYTIANFGHIPYGKTFIGKLIKPDPSNLCDVDIKVQNSKKNDPNMPIFLLGQRGSCKFTQKALNAQKSGASLAIIQDNDNAESGRIVMANDGKGFQVQIPSIFISYESGEKLKTLISESNNELIIRIQFDTQRSDVVLFRMWLDSNDRHSYVLMRDFKQYHQALNKYIDSELFFKISQSCPFCDANNCIITSNENKYCYIPSRNSTMNGKQVIEASLRSYFAFKLNQNKWWDYMDKFDRKCIMLKTHATCAEQALNKLGYDVKNISAQIENEKNKAKQGTKDSVLSLWANEASRGNILFYPDITINNINYQGQLIATDIFQMVCNSLNKPPYQCESFVDYQTQKANPGTSVGAIIFYTLLIMTIGFIIVLIIFKKCLKNRMKVAVANEVNQMVSQYISFYDKDGKTVSEN